MRKNCTSVKLQYSEHCVVYPGATNMVESFVLEETILSEVGKN